MLTSPDGITWTDSPFTDDYYVNYPRLADVDGTMMIGSDEGIVLSSANQGASWIQRNQFLQIQGVYRMISAGKFAVAVVQGSTDQGDGNYVTAVEEGSWDLSPLSKIDDAAFTLVATPVGVLIADGSLGRDPTNIENRERHTIPFLAGATDGNRVVIVDSAGASISLDGGETFVAAGRFPTTH